MGVIYAYYVSSTGAPRSEQILCACGVAVRVDGEGKVEVDSAKRCSEKGDLGCGSEAGEDGNGGGL